jgi:hypothetical protein
VSGQATITLPDGTQRRLGNNPPPVSHVPKLFPEFGTTPTTTLIPRSQWQPVDLSRFRSPIKDQDGEGACNAFDSIYILEACRRLQGLPDVLLSPGYLYGHINGGSDDGSLLEDAMASLMTLGTCTAATVPELDWRNRPPAAATEALKYRALEVLVCPTFDHMASAILQGFFVSSGLSWCDNFTPGADGWLPMRGNNSVGGHAVARDQLATKGGVWGLGGPNSWGPSWGLAGGMFIAESLYDNQIGGFWAIRSVVDEGGQVPTS